MRWLSLCLAGFTLVALVGCSRTPSSAFQPPAGYAAYTAEANLFSLAYPATWEQATASIPGLAEAAQAALGSVQAGATLSAATVVFFAGLAAGGGYSPNVNVTVSPAPPGQGFADNVAAEIDGLRQVMRADYRELERTRLTVARREATLIEYGGTFAAENLATLGPVHNLVLLAQGSQVMWVVTCTSVGGAYARWAGDFHNIVRSFRLPG